MTDQFRILLLEDQGFDAKLITRELERAHPDAVVTWIEGEAALRAALAVGPAWDVVLSDWAMPGFGALGALRIVRALQPELPFIIVSGTIGEELAVEAMREGANDYVLKDKLARLVPAIEREIRDARRAEGHRRTEARFRALIEKGAEAVLLTSEDGTIAYASPASTPIFGLFPQELVGKRFGDLVHPEDRNFAASTLLRLREDRAIGVPVECRIQRADSSTRWIAVTGSNLLDDPAVGAIVANLRDVTERRRSAEALRASEARFNRLAESGIIGIVTSELGGNIIDANDAYFAMTGYTRSEMRAGGLRWGNLLPLEQDAAGGEKALLLRRNGFAAPYETLMIRKDGTRMPILIGVAVQTFPTATAFVVDLTDKRRTEVALRATEEQLRQAQKMEAVGRLAGGVAHDFNNVLSIILSYAEMLLDELPADDPKRDDITEIFQAGWRAADLTRQLLMFSRQQMLEPKLLDLDTVVGSMDKMLRRVLGEDVQLVTVRGDGPCRIKADPSSIEQVIMNLAVNARDAMPVGGKLTLETATVPLDEGFAEAHAGVKPGLYVMLAVTDTGVGMDPATQARIFEPFFTTKPKDKGTGLGLSTVFGIAQQSGGSVWVESAVGAGTTFRVYLPCVQGEPEPARAPVSPSAGGTETILLVEDEAPVRAVARQILERHGYTVIEAADGAVALALAERHGKRIDLLLTDVVMPQMSGPELARRLRAGRPGLRVLCMSGYTDDSIVRHGIASSDIAFLMKPLTPDALARKVREVLDATGPTG